MADIQPTSLKPFKPAGDFNYGLQRAIYGTFRQPKGSLMSKAVHKIDDYAQNEVSKYNLATSMIMKRVIAVAMPIIALLDTIRYAAAFVWKVITLKPNHALYNLSKCQKSLQIFFTSILALPFALISPSSIYRTSRMQVEKLQLRLAKKMQQKISHKDSNEEIKEKLIAYAEKRLSNKRNIDLLKLMATELTDAKTIKNADDTESVIPALLPSHEDTRRQIVLEEYIKLYAYIISYCTSEKVNLDQESDDFCKVFMEAISYKNPEKRQMIMSSLLSSVNDDRDILPELSQEVQNRVRTYHTLPLFAANQITDDEKIIARLVGALNGTYFTSQKNIRAGELTGYLQQLDACDISDELKERVLDSLIQHYETSEALFAEEKQRKVDAQEEAQKLSKDVDTLRDDLAKAMDEKADLEEQIEFFETMYTSLQSTDDADTQEKFIKEAEEQYLAKKLQKLAQNENMPDDKRPRMKKGIESSNAKLFNEIRKNGPNGRQPRQITGLVSKLRKTNGNISKIEDRIHAHEEASDIENVVKVTVDPTKFANDGIKNLTTVLSLNDETLIASVVDNIGKDKKYPTLASKEIISDLFISTFELENTNKEKLYDSLEHLRAPAALIKFHNRIKKYPSKHREAISEASRAVVDSVIAGTFWEDRHSIEDNPHLARVFDGRPKLFEQWCTPEVTTIGELIADVSDKYAGLKVIDATDPTDIYKVGDDLNTCVNLDGRLHKIVGMLGLVKDGKNHSLLVKSDDGETLAETQLQLMWDKENNKPVLYLEEANYVGQNEGDHTLETALIEFAKKKAADMGLDLVSQWDTHKKDTTILGDEYDGTVSSLGSSSPIEFVNSLHENYTRPYSIGKTYIIYHRTKKKTVGSGWQLWCDGGTNSSKAKRIANDLTERAPEGVRFNAKRINGKVRDGTCTAMCVEFAKKYFQKLNDGTVTDEMTTQEYEKMLERIINRKFSKSCKHFRTVQEAMNTIEVDTSLKDKVDLERNKVQALVNFRHFAITEATETYDLDTEKQGKLLKKTKTLKDGVHFFRMTKPKNNKKLEDYGHSMVLIKDKKHGIFFYDPNLGVKRIDSQWIADEMFTHMKMLHGKYKLSKSTFYHMEPTAEFMKKYNFETQTSSAA